MIPYANPAAKLEPSQRMALAIQTLTEDTNISRRVAANDVSRN
jgi:hypothetical protein